MIIRKKKSLKIVSLLVLCLIIVLSVNIFINKEKRDEIKSKEKKIFVKPGEIKTIEYTVENLEDLNSTGIATFAYFPSQFGNYIRKLNCFCYDAKTLKSKQKDNYSVVILIDPEVTKDNRTKNIKEVTIQFTFFDYKEYKENKS